MPPCSGRGGSFIWVDGFHAFRRLHRFLVQLSDEISLFYVQRSSLRLSQRIRSGPRRSLPCPQQGHSQSQDWQATCVVSLLNMEDMPNNWNTEAAGITRIDQYRFWARCFQRSASPRLATEVPARDTFRRSKALPKTLAMVQLSCSSFLFHSNFANP